MKITHFRNERSHHEIFTLSISDKDIVSARITGGEWMNLGAWTKPESIVDILARLRLLANSIERGNNIKNDMETHESMMNGFFYRIHHHRTIIDKIRRWWYLLYNRIWG